MRIPSEPFVWTISLVIVRCSGVSTIARGMIRLGVYLPRPATAEFVLAFLVLSKRDSLDQSLPVLSIIVNAVLNSPVPALAVILNLVKSSRKLCMLCHLHVASRRIIDSSFSSLLKSACLLFQPFTYYPSLNFYLQKTSFIPGRLHGRKETWSIIFLSSRRYFGRCQRDA